MSRTLVHSAIRRWMRGYLIRSATVGFGWTLVGNTGLLPVTWRAPTNFLWSLVGRVTALDFLHTSLLSEILIGLAGGLVWMMFRPRLDEESERVPRQLAAIFARYATGSLMLAFGMWKVLLIRQGQPAQMWPPLPPELIRPFGDWTGGFFWAWSGVAPTYSMFTGWVEIVGGALLFSRRTMLLGTLLNMLAFLNIALLVATFNPWWRPFTTSSGGRLLPLLFIVWHQWPRIRGILLRDEAYVPRMAADVWGTKPWIGRIVTAGQVIVVLRLLHGVNFPERYQSSHYRRPRFAIEAAYEVERFTRNGKDLPPDSGADRWWMVGIENCTGTVRYVDERKAEFRVVADSISGKSQPCSLARPQDFEFDYGDADTLRYTSISFDRIRFAGRMKGDTIDATLRRIPDDAFPLWNPAWFWTRTGSPSGWWTRGGT